MRWQRGNFFLPIVALLRVVVVAAAAVFVNDNFSSLSNSLHLSKLYETCVKCVHKLLLIAAFVVDSLLLNNSTVP